MSQPIIVAGRLVIEDQTKKGMDSAKKGITGALKSIATSAAGFLARDVVNSLVSAGKESVQLGSKIETLKTSFEAMRDPVLDSDLTIENLRAAVQDTVSDIDLLTAANNAMALGLPTNELDDMFAAAQKVGAAMGRTTLEAVQDLTTGIGRQSKMILDNLGILVDTASAYDTFAASVGKSASELTDAERKTAFMNAAIDSLNEKAAELGDNLSESQLAQEQFSAAITNLKTDIGEILIPILTEAMEVFSGIISTIKEVVAAIKDGDWDTAADAIADAFIGLGTKIIEVITNIDWLAVIATIIKIGLKIGGALVNAILDAAFGGDPTHTAFDVEPLSTDIQAQEGFHGTLGQDATIRAHAGERVDISPAGEGGGETTVIFNIANFIGLDEESARTLGNIAANQYLSELDRRAVRR